jgi:arylsulfatase A-like enzyme
MRAQAILASLLLACTAERPAERIVLVVVDTLRRDQLSVYGAEVRTPNVERLARRGTVHQRAVSSFHQTSMSMGALFTGRTPSLESGVPDRTVDFVLENWCGQARFFETEEETCLPSALPTLGEVMRRQGYWTVGIASNPLTHRPAGFDRGFDEWVEVTAGRRQQMLAFSKDEFKRRRWAALRSGELTTEAAIEALSRRPSDRFFLYAHYMDVHDWHFRRVTYRETVELMDAALGDLLDYLEAEGLMEDAVIVFTSDHGEALKEEHMIPGPPRHIGNPSFETLLRVPLLIVGAEPEDRPLVRSEDLFHLLARVAGAQAPPPSPLAPDELFLSEFVWRTYRAGRWKSFWHRGEPVSYLVDLEADPGERRDVAAAHPDVMEEHRLRIDQLTTELAAPGAPSKELDPKLVELLRQLGYVE